MAYSTETDVKQACGGQAHYDQLFALDGQRTADSATVLDHIASADARINSYIVKQYLVPLVAPIPVEIRDVSARMARYLRLSRRGGMVDTNSQLNFDADIKWLEGVRDGLNALGVTPQPSPSSMRVDSSLPISLSKDVSRAKLRGFS